MIDFSHIITKLQAITFDTMEDFGDKLNSVYTVFILIVFTTLITTKQYITSPITCYTPVIPHGGINFKEYVESYCWVKGTVVDNGSNIPYQEKIYTDNKNTIYYYQWIPFVLGLQCLMFYLPHFIWKLFCRYGTGMDLNYISIKATKAKYSTEELNELVQVTDSFIRNNNICSFIIILFYSLVKLLYVTNTIGQLYLMKKFLNIKSFFGSMILNHIWKNNYEWQESKIFPRIVLCGVKNVLSTLGSRNYYLSQCVLSVNMLSEKIYIFLWFWFLINSFITILSLSIWIIRCIKSVRWIKNVLKRCDCISDDNTFIFSYLKYDGIFFMRMLELDSGSGVVEDLICRLYEKWNLKTINKYILPDVNLSTI